MPPLTITSASILITLKPPPPLPPAPPATIIKYSTTGAPTTPQPSTTGPDLIDPIVPTTIDPIVPTTAAPGKYLLF